MERAAMDEQLFLPEKAMIFFLPNYLFLYNATYEKKMELITYVRSRITLSLAIERK